MGPNTPGGKHYDQTQTLRIVESHKKNFAAIGMNYDGIGFYDDAPFPSWYLIQRHIYGAHSYPDDGNTYQWNESLKDWVQTAPDW